MKATLLSLFTLCINVTVDAQTEKKAIADMLDDWHTAAAEADFERYFSHFENDSSIFMGTDATERWKIAGFRPWSKPFFDRGKAWGFSAVERHIYLSSGGKTAWFDERLDTPNLGPCRGTGVLVLHAKGWKIAHYNLSITIPNELVDELIPKIDSVLNK